MPDLIDRLLNLERRLQHLESVGLVGQVGDADTVDGTHALGLFVWSDSANSGTTFVPNVASQTFETDGNAVLTLNITVVSTVTLLIPYVWDSGTARGIAFAAQAIMDDTTVSANSTGYVGALVVDYRIQNVLICRFTGVSVASHTFKVQFARYVGGVGGGDVINVYRRYILGLVTPE